LYKIIVKKILRLSYIPNKVNSTSQPNDFSENITKIWYFNQEFEVLGVRTVILYRKTLRINKIGGQPPNPRPRRRVLNDSL